MISIIQILVLAVMSVGIALGCDFAELGPGDEPNSRLGRLN